MKILFLTPYPEGQSPSQRFRFEQYFSLLKMRGILYTVKPFFNQSTWQVLYQKGHSLRKALGVLTGFLNRFYALASLHQFDFVFIHREAAPLGPPFFEWMIAKLFRKKIIYDFDDAIWLSNTSEENNMVSKLKWHSKVSTICKWSHAVSCGNNYLCDFARQYNGRVFLNPTTIDTEELHNPSLCTPKRRSHQLVIGWTGTHSTLKYIDSILPIIQSLEKKFPDEFQFMVIADKKPSFEFSSLRFVQWSKETEIQDLFQFDIGIMPLTDDVWAKGKCGFKALQYMALGIPALASPVGVNSQIINDGVNGFLCNSPEQWESTLIKLINNETLRKEIGENARKRVVEHYSVSSNSLNFLSLFE